MGAGQPHATAHARRAHELAMVDPSQVHCCARKGAERCLGKAGPRINGVWLVV